MKGMMEYYYEPGNATGYRLAYGQIDNRKNEYLVVWFKDREAFGPALKWKHFDGAITLSVNHIMNKMGIGEGDAEAIAKFIEQHYATRVAENKEDEG